MVDEFRAAFQELIDASVATDSQHFPPAVHKVYVLASQVPVAERELALEALTPLLSGGHSAPGIIADLTVIAGALVEMGTDPGPTGVEVLHRMRTMGRGAIVFTRAWERTGTDAPPDPESVTAADETRVAATLGTDAPGATMCWWTIRRHGLAARTMLGHTSVRTHVRSDPALHAELVAIANQLSAHLVEFDDIHSLLRMAEATSALVMDRHSGRGFRVLFDGVGDNFQLHTLLADALVGPDHHGLAGERPDPRWVAPYLGGQIDPQAQTVRGWWNLVAHDGTWVWNEGLPAEIPTLDGERVLILDEQPYPRSWNAGRRHPHVHGWLEVESELTAQEAATWWKRIAPAEPALPGHDEDHTPIPEPVVLTDEDGFGSEPVHGFVPPTGTPAPAATPAPEPEPAPLTAPEPEPEPAPTAEADPEPAASAEPTPADEPEDALVQTTLIPIITPDMVEDPVQEDTAPPRPDPGQAPGASMLPPLPPGVSRSSSWGPSWR
ncbi:hypothetical protein [Nocardiopsis lucentensis]|uniref:hypothetical protein n=1 Tax=Nocardiopsis lucentensis TaxID=53441 RepID=UPI0003459F11|nr:hypothetical protein [Nocardiopsis lucentensis]